MDDTPLITIVETPGFLSMAKKLFSEDGRAELVLYLAANPESGALMPGTGGARKLRWARQGMGKSGGARIIYYYHDKTIPVFLLSAFAKNEKINLSKEEKNELRLILPQIVGLYKRRRKSK